MTIRKMSVLRLLACVPLAACALSSREGRARDCSALALAVPKIAVPLLLLLGDSIGVCT
jgi:hypothetical protein